MKKRVFPCIVDRGLSLQSAVSPQIAVFPCRVQYFSADLTFCLFRMPRFPAECFVSLQWDTAFHNFRNYSYSRVSIFHTIEMRKQINFSVTFLCAILKIFSKLKYCTCLCWKTTLCMKACIFFRYPGDQWTEIFFLYSLDQCFIIVVIIHFIIVIYNSVEAKSAERG